MVEYSQIFDIILKSLNKEANPEEEALLKSWVDSDPRHSDLLLKFKDPEWLRCQLRDAETLGKNSGSAKEKVLAKWAEVKKLQS